MRVVGAGDEHRVDKAAPRQRRAVRECGHAVRARLAQRHPRPFERALDRVGDRGDNRARRDGEVLEVLDPHHPRAHQTVSDLLFHLALLYV